MTTTDTTDTTVVVVEERRRRFPVPLVVAVAGVVLLGASTFALWTASGELTGGSITAGDLDLSLKGDPEFYDVSADRNDNNKELVFTGSGVYGHEVNPTNWRIVPGDKVAVVYGAQVTLDGDNLVAALSVTAKNPDGLTIKGMTYTYEVFQGTEQVLPETELESGALLYLAAPETVGAVGPNADAEAITPVHSMDAATEDFTVVVYGTFDDTVESTLDSAKATDALTGLALTLTQVRDAGAVFEINP